MLASPLTLTVQQFGERWGDPFEVSYLRREDWAFVKASVRTHTGFLLEHFTNRCRMQHPSFDVLQCNNQSVRTRCLSALVAHSSCRAP